MAVALAVALTDLGGKREGAADAVNLDEVLVFCRESFGTLDSFNNEDRLGEGRVALTPTEAFVPKLDAIIAWIINIINMVT